MACSGEEILEADSCESRGEVADDAGFAGSSADGFSHFKDFEPVAAAGELVELAVLHGDCTCMLCEVESGCRIVVHAGDHIVFGFLGSAGLGDVDDEGLFKIGDLESVGETGGVGVVEEVDFEIAVALGVGFLIPVRTVDRHLEQLGAESGSADTVDEGGFKLLSGGADDFSGADSFDESFDVLILFGAGVDGAVGEVGDFAVLVWVLDFSALDLEHFFMHADEAFAHVFDVRVGEIHSGEVDLKSGSSVHESVLVAAIGPIVHVQFSCWFYIW